MSEVINCEKEVSSWNNRNEPIHAIIINGLIVYYSRIKELLDCYQLFDGNDQLILSAPKSCITNFCGEGLNG
jgi:hypothetical protein